METQTSSVVTLNQPKPELISETVDEEIHARVDGSNCKCPDKNKRKGKPIPGFAREIILKVAAICEEEAKNNCSKYALNAPTKRAAMYTGVSERTIQRIRNEERKKLDENGKNTITDNQKSVIRDHPDEKSNYSTMKRKSKRGQTIPNSAREMISRVIDACDSEYKDGGFIVPFISKSKRTSIYTGVSQRTIQRIKQEDEMRNKTDQEKILKTPGKKRKRSTFNDKIDDFDFHSIRSLIDDLVLVRKVTPTCTALHLAVKERINFPYSEDTLYRLLHAKGFVWYKGSKGKRVLLEKPDIFKARFDYLQRIKNYEEQGKFIIYLDEKWIGRIEENCYIDNKEIFEVKGGICCSGRLVILNEFSAVGFIRRAQRLFKPNIVDSGTKPDISTVDKWMKENLFPNIPSNSVIVMSTNPYKKEDSNIPNEYSTKPTLVSFLKEKNIKFNTGQTCLELYGVIKDYYAKLPSEWCEVDRMIEDCGHTVLRLPPYMSEFSPIELAWADIKRYVRDKNPAGKISSKLVKEITLQAIECLQNETLQGYVNHVIEMENYFWDKQRLIQQHYDNIAKNNRSSDFSDSNMTNTTEFSNTSITSMSNNNSDVLSHKNSCIMPFVNSSLPTNSITSNHPVIDSYASMLPHNQLGFGKNASTPMIEKPTVICETQLIDGGMQAGPSYMNL